jgi:hypothetical protein
MKRAVTLSLAAIAGLLAAGIAMALVVPGTQGRYSGAMSLVVAVACVVAFVGAAAFLTRKEKAEPGRE